MTETYHAMSHFILYAKGWYKRNNLEEDMEYLMQDYTGIDKKYISKSDTFHVLNDFAYDVIQKSGNPKNNFFKYISDVEKEGFIYAAMRLFSVMKVTGLNLEEPDTRVLPLNYE